MTEGDLPTAISEFEDRVTRVWRTCFDDMRKRVDVPIAGTTHTAGIDDQPSITEPNRPGDMSVGAEDERLRDALSRLFNRFLGCLYYCLQTGQTYAENQAFPAAQPLAA